MTADHQKTLGNFGAKPRLKHGDTEYVFSWPCPKVFADMERLVKDAALESLIDSRSYLTPEDYSAESREHKRRCDTGYYKGPNGDGFKAFFDATGGSGIQAVVAVVYCLLAPNHPGLEKETVLNLLGERQDEVNHILGQLMPAEVAGAVVPKAASGA